MKTRFKYGLLAAAIFYSLPGMASTTSSEGGAFTVKMAKSSTVDDIKGCPTLETPLKLTFTEDMKPLPGGGQTSTWYDGWLGWASQIDPWKDMFHNTRFTAKNHEIHIYVDFFSNPDNRFSDKGGIFTYTNNNVMYSNGEYQWQHMPSLGQYVYKAVIPSWNKGETKSIYLPSRNFKSVEVFYFQDNIPYWDRRNDYSFMKQKATQLKSYYDISEFETGLKKGGDVNAPPQAGDSFRTAETLFLYQKLTRSNAKDTTIAFKQKRGAFNQYETSLHWTREIILLGGPGSETLRNKDLNNQRYMMEDSGTFSNSLKIDSIDLKLMENKRIGPMASTGTYIASYERSDFSMTPENQKICGLD
ncbi:pilus biosynthesis protein [Escherichia albertii]